jgi:GDPmannose 4,6-dehydratase
MQTSSAGQTLPDENGLESVKRALITGIGGQDGSYLAELLNGKGYEVFGLLNGQATRDEPRLRETLPFVTLLRGDLQDLSSLIVALERSEPTEVYNLGAISFVELSFRQPELTTNVTGLGALRLLEAIRLVGGTQRNPIRFYQASSSEMFGNAAECPQDEDTIFRPRSPYGVAKVLGHHFVVHYRDAYGLFACSGICFNHESPRRGLEFVTRKITHGAARIKSGLQTELRLGTLHPQRDWGFAGDYVRAMWLMLQQTDPEDYVVATGQLHSVSDVLDRAFEAADVGRWDPFVRMDPRHVRPTEVDALVGDASKAQRLLGWRPSITFEELIRMMVEADMELAALEAERVSRRFDLDAPPRSSVVGDLR